MTEKLIQYTYGEARYEALKELDTRGRVGTILLKHHADLINTVNVMCHTLETAMAPDFEDVKTLGNMPLNIKQDLISILSRYPSYMLVHSDCNWTVFTSAFVLLVTNYLNLMESFNEACGLNEDDAWWKKEQETVEYLRSCIEGIINLIEIGTSYKTLIQASNEIVAELKTWGAHRPAAMRLSQLYLRSLGIKTEGE